MAFLTKRNGFTLIELLVVITIITILSVVGFVSFQNVQKSARDAKIKADLNAIKKAYEVNYDPSANGGQGGYLPLTSSQFANNQIPKKPDNTDYTYAYGPDSVSTGNKTDGYKVTATLSDGTTSTSVISNQGTQSGSQLNSCDPGATLSNGLVGYWKMDEASWNGTSGEVADSSGNRNNGTSGGRATTAAGKFNNGGSFNGIEDTVSIPDANSLHFGTGDFTVAFWLNVSGSLTANTEYGIINKNSSFQNNPGWGIEITTWGGGSLSTYQVTFYNTGPPWGNAAVSSPVGGISINRWYHVVGTRQGTTAKLYVDGLLTGSKTHSDAALSVDNSQPITIADHSWGPNLPAKIDDVRLYNRVLAQSDIDLLYSGCVQP